MARIPGIYITKAKKLAILLKRYNRGNITQREHKQLTNLLESMRVAAETIARMREREKRTFEKA